MSDFEGNCLFDVKDFLCWLSTFIYDQNFWALKNLRGAYVSASDQ